MKKFAGFSILAAVAFASNHLFFKGLTTDSTVSKVSKQPDGFASMDKMERLQAWSPLTESLAVCKYTPAACSNKKGPQEFALVAGAKMKQNVSGGFISFVALFCAGVGIFVSKWWTTNKSAPNKEKDEGQYQPVPDQDVEQGSSSGFDSTSSLITGDGVKTRSALQKRLHNALTYWTGSSFSLTHPAVTYKLFIALLLFIELNDFMAPETSALSTPELIQLYRTKPDYNNELVPDMVEWFMPGLTNDTASVWVERANAIRGLLLASWFVYLLLPSRQVWLAGISYALGAVAYFYLGTIGLMYNQAHTMQGLLLLIVCSIPTVPFLACPKNGPRAARWLRRFLYLCVLIPSYLFVGISKIRYFGISTNLSGEWLKSALASDTSRATIPWLSTYIGAHTWAAMLVSWGNLVTELLVPLATILWMENSVVRNLFHSSCILYHISVFLLTGSNFTGYCLMHLLAWDPLGWFCPQRAERDRAVVVSPVSWKDWVRIGIAAYVIFSWFWVQFMSDVLHLTGQLDATKTRNPLFPFSELSTFDKPTKDANYVAAFLLVVLSAFAYVYVMFSDRSMDHESRVARNQRNIGIENAKKLSLEKRLELAREGPTLIFDGICNLCNGSMSWFQQRCRDDSPVWYMWAQHQDTHEFLDEVGITRQDILKSWAYIDEGIVYRGSTAWLMALGNLRAPWCYLSSIGKLCPVFIRETVYNFVAANRYNALGHSDACQRPNPAMRARFLHTTAVRGEQDGAIPPPQRKRVLVIGCGPAGLFVAKKLASKKGGDFSVVVVEPKDYYEFTPGILRGMCDPESMDELVFKLEPVLCNDLGITFVQGVVTGLESRHATVTRVPGGVLHRAAADEGRDDFLIESSDAPSTVRVDFDYCVVASGSHYVTSTLWKVPTKLADKTADMSKSYSLEGRLDELAKEHARLKQLNDQQSGCVSIMGAGLVGVELAGEIRHHFPNIRQVKLFDPMPTVLPPLADSAQKSAAKWLRNHNVELVLGDQFNKKTVAAAERDSDVVYRAVGVRTRSGFLPGEVLDERGQIRVNAAMQIVRDGNPMLFGAGRIFAIGDCVTVEGASTPYVKDIYPAEAMAGVVVENVRRALIVQCIQTRPGILKEIKPLMVMNLCSLGPDDCIFTLHKWTILRGRPATFIKWMIQYTKMSDSRNEILGRVIWSVIPH